MANGRWIGLAALMVLSACGSSRDATRGQEGYAIEENEDGSIHIYVTEGASGETMIQALMAAASRTGWTPPETAGPLRQIEHTEAGETTQVYRYDLENGFFTVFVYIAEEDLETQIVETRTAFDMLIDQGQLDAYTQTRRTREEIPWGEGTGTVHRVAYAQTRQGEAWESVMYLLEDGIHWIKVRVTIPQAAYSQEDIDGWVRTLLGG